MKCGTHVGRLHHGRDRAVGGGDGVDAGGSELGGGVEGVDVGQFGLLRASATE